MLLAVFPHLLLPSCQSQRADINDVYTHIQLRTDFKRTWTCKSLGWNFCQTKNCLNVFFFSLFNENWTKVKMEMARMWLVGLENKCVHHLAVRPPGPNSHLVQQCYRTWNHIFSWRFVSVERWCRSWWLPGEGSGSLYVAFAQSPCSLATLVYSQSPI